MYGDRLGIDRCTYGVRMGVVCAYPFFSLADAFAIDLWLLPLHLETRFATLRSLNMPFLLGKLIPANRCQCAINDIIVCLATSGECTVYIHCLITSLTAVHRPVFCEKYCTYIPMLVFAYR